MIFLSHRWLTDSKVRQMRSKSFLVAALSSVLLAGCSSSTPHGESVATSQAPTVIDSRTLSAKLGCTRGPGPGVQESSAPGATYYECVGKLTEIGGAEFILFSSRGAQAVFVHDHLDAAQNGVDVVEGPYWATESSGIKAITMAAVNLGGIES
jgi:hypothetical protein